MEEEEQGNDTEFFVPQNENVVSELCSDELTIAQPHAILLIVSCLMIRGGEIMSKESTRNASHLMKLVHHLRFQRLRTFHQSDGIFLGQPPVLFCLRSKGEMSQRELADALDQTPASMTVTLGRMEKSGLVRRESDLTDKRVQRVSITEKGREVCRQAYRSESAVDQEMFMGFSEEEITVIADLMTRCAKNVARATGHLKEGDHVYEEYLRHVGPAPEEGETEHHG